MMELNLIRLYKFSGQEKSTYLNLRLISCTDFTDHTDLYTD